MATAEFPEKLRFLFQPSRYKVAYGGRGGAKSWGFARALLIQGATSPLRVLCAREIQKSITDSSHKLLCDQIDALGLSGFYVPQERIIRARNGTEIIFAGLKHNIGSIKSKEGVDRVWVEEADKVSKTSWDTLIPTIRKPGSEIWISFNPSLELDDTYQRFVVRPPASACVVKVGWQDNPWFPDVLEQERLDLLAKDPDAYNHVWEGAVKEALDGAIYADELRRARAEGRICKVPYDPTKPVITSWDLGRADITAIWFAQHAGLSQVRLIDYYESSGKHISHYLQELQKRGYVYGKVWLPHDAEAKVIGAPKTVYAQVREAGYDAAIVPRIGVANGINAARGIFPNCYFDEERCGPLGLHALRHYAYKVDPVTGQRSKEPDHNWASHPADAFRYLAVAIREPTQQRQERRRRLGGAGWQGA